LAIVCIALLLLVSLVVHAAVTALSDELVRRPFSSLSVLLVHVFNHSLFADRLHGSLCLCVQVSIRCTLTLENVWEGALFTAILFSVGKHLISLYIGAKHVSTTYGAIGSAVMLLVWVFDSSQLVFFGAQFTRALATQRGYSLDPTTMAPDVDGLRLKEEQKAEA
jgi:membrane protein